MLETCDKESIVYINCGDDINSIDEICDYKNTDKNFYDIKYNKMEYHKSVIRVIISIIASITIISILYFLQN